MSPLLDVNFADVPDEFLPVEPGRYTLEIREAPSQEPTRDGKSQKLVVSFVVVDTPKYENRTLQDHISLKMLTRIKRLFMSAGITPGAEGVRTEDLVGKRVTATIGTRTYKDDSGEERETSRIIDYVVD